MGQHSLVTEQLREIEAARQRAVATPDPDRIGRMIQLLRAHRRARRGNGDCFWRTKSSRAASFDRSLDKLGMRGARRHRRDDRRAVHQRRLDA